jgi:hypothetical protein
MLASRAGVDIRTVGLRGAWLAGGAVVVAAVAIGGQGRCLTAVGNPDADAPLRQARAVFDQMGARRRVDECDTLIARASKLTS